MVLTTATVQSGASGGAVLSPSGALVALVTSNARHTRSGAVIPNLNFGIAAPALRPLWDHLAAGKVRDCIQGLTQKSCQIAQLALQPALVRPLCTQSLIVRLDTVPCTCIE